MQTKTLIQMQANVVKITSLKIGNVIKIMEKEYADTYKTVYGVVLDMQNNGKETFVTILKYVANYQKIEASIQTYSGTCDLNIFPTTTEEVRKSLHSTIEAIKRKIVDDEKELADKKASLAEAIKFVEGEKSKQLSEASFTEISQTEYENLALGNHTEVME
jgi:queuine/archaeosine tRNA-ribosyltransferase